MTDQTYASVCHIGTTTANRVPTEGTLEIERKEGKKKTNDYGIICGLLQRHSIGG